VRRVPAATCARHATMLAVVDVTHLEAFRAGGESIQHFLGQHVAVHINAAGLAFHGLFGRHGGSLMVPRFGLKFSGNIRQFAGVGVAGRRMCRRDRVYK